MGASQKSQPPSPLPSLPFPSPLLPPWHPLHPSFTLPPPYPIPTSGTPISLVRELPFTTLYRPSTSSPLTFSPLTSLNSPLPSSFGLSPASHPPPLTKRKIFPLHTTLLPWHPSFLPRPPRPTLTPLLFTSLSSPTLLP